MAEITLKEVCIRFNVSRRAVQGYEKAGLVCASGKTDRGYLLYDSKSQERIRLIKQYQQFGFSVRKITELIDAPPSVLKDALKKQAKILEKQHTERAQFLERLYELIDSM